MIGPHKHKKKGPPPPKKEHKKVSVKDENGRTVIKIFYINNGIIAKRRSRVIAETGGQISGNRGQNANQGGQIARKGGQNANQEGQIAKKRGRNKINE